MPVAEARQDLFIHDDRRKRLAEVYAPCFTLILQLRSTEEYGDPEVLRQRIKDLLDRADREASRMGASTEDMRRTKFALVAFIDETILSTSWSHRDAWTAKPLQLELYNRYDAGEEFFEKLKPLLDDPERHAEVLEIYYLCMALGFKGRYQLHEQERLRILIEDSLKALRDELDVGRDQLAPHGKPRDQVTTEVRNRLPVWVIVAAAAAIAVIVYFGLSLWINDVASDAATSIQQLVVNN